MKKRVQRRRVPQRWLAVRDPDTDEQTGVLLDVSVCGLRLMTHREVEVGETLHVSFVATDEFERPRTVEAFAECRWCRSLCDGYYEVGMDTTRSVSDADLNAIAGLYLMSVKA